MNTEQHLWMAVIHRRVLDAIYPFKIIVERSDSAERDIEMQFEKYKKDIQNGRHLPRLRGERLRNMRQGICYLETDRLDVAAEACGYSSVFVNKLFSLCQKCITLRKGLYALQEENDRARKITQVVEKFRARRNLGAYNIAA